MATLNVSPKDIDEFFILTTAFADNSRYCQSSLKKNAFSDRSPRAIDLFVGMTSSRTNIINSIREQYCTMSFRRLPLSLFIHSNGTQSPFTIGARKSI